MARLKRAQVGINRSRGKEFIPPGTVELPGRDPNRQDENSGRGSGGEPHPDAAGRRTNLFRATAHFRVDSVQQRTGSALVKSATRNGGAQRLLSIQRDG